MWEYRKSTFKMGRILLLGGLLRLWQQPRIVGLDSVSCNIKLSMHKKFR